MKRENLHLCILKQRHAKGLLLNPMPEGPGWARCQGDCLALTDGETTRMRLKTSFAVTTRALQGSPYRWPLSSRSCWWSRGRVAVTRRAFFLPFLQKHNTNKCSLSDLNSIAMCETKTIPPALHQPAPLLVAGSVLLLAVRNSLSVNAIKGMCVSALFGVRGAGPEMELLGHKQVFDRSQ